MRWTALLLALLCAAAYADLQLAEPCDEEFCQLPDCRCSSTNIPGGLQPRDTPQFITVTFDDAVATTNIDTYREMLVGRRNSNNCPAGATFYVSHEYTDYSLVNELYNYGFEIALHSISHRTPQTAWQEATEDFIKEEIVDQRIQMAHFANIPFEAMQGVRLPFLQLSGNTSFQVMKDNGLLYDCSWPTISHTNPGLWPYTLDYASIQDCPITPCPTASIPGAWVQPMVAWTDLQGFPCSMVDSCVFPPDRNDADAWFQFILTNFERHYMGNRAPFGFYIHEGYLRAWPAVKEATMRFLDVVNSLPDTFMVNAKEVVDWVQKPIPIDEYRQNACRSWLPSTCNRNFCGPLNSAHNEWSSYYMTICNVCPSTYPWVGNPLGQ